MPSPEVRYRPARRMILQKSPSTVHPGHHGVPYWTTMTRNPLLRRSAVAVALLTTLAFGACGGDDETDTGTETAGSASAGATDEEAGGETGDAVEIVDFNYKPADLKVKAGTTVTFTNVDTFAHTVTAKDKSFDSGNMDEKATF